MGLDMYLKVEKYVSGYEHSSDDEKAIYKQLADLAGLPDVGTTSKSATVLFAVAYWRKANHIHNWFVENVQGGRDECQLAYVSREQLQTLLDTCKKVLGLVECVKGDVKTGQTWHPDGTIEQHTKPGRVVAQQGIAAQLLPTAEGFFFGGTDYDEFYLQDIQDTIDMIEPLLQDETLQGWSFYYQSSW